MPVPDQFAPTLVMCLAQVTHAVAKRRLSSFELVFIPALDLGARGPVFFLTGVYRFVAPLRDRFFSAGMLVDDLELLERAAVLHILDHGQVLAPGGLHVLVVLDAETV